MSAVSPATSPQNSGLIDTAQTYGWDTVFAIHIRQVNTAIVAGNTSPRTFAQSDSDDGIDIKGQFGDWAVTTGGAGDLIRLSIPFLNTIITKRGSAGPTLAGTILTEVRLDLLRDERTPNLRHLRVRPDAPTEEIRAASVVDVHFVGPQADFLSEVSVKTLIGHWLNAHLSAFTHAFATIDIGRKAAKEAFQWMQPTNVEYAFTDLGTDGDGALAVLSMTQGRRPDGLIQQVSSACIPSGQSAAFLVSKERLIQELLLPSMPRLFPGALKGDFALSATGNSIVTSRPDVNFTAKGSDGREYVAFLEDLQISIFGGELRFDVTTKVTLAPGMFALARTIDSFCLGLGQTSNGAQTLIFRNSGAPVVTHWTETDPGIRFVEELLLFVAFAVDAVATVLSLGAAAVAFAATLAFAAGVLAAAEAIIESTGRDKAPSIDAVVLDATAAIKWPLSSDFRIRSAQLNDSLQLIGTLES